MKKISEYLFLGALGGTIYHTIEVLFRGYSHWSMFLLGGLSMDFFLQQGLWIRWKDRLWKQVLRGSVFVASGEFVTGIIVNKILRWNIWDYSKMPLNLWGQICLPFTLIFSGLCICGIYIAGMLAFYLYHEEKPSFIKGRNVV